MPVAVVIRSVVSFCNQLRSAQLTCEDKMKIKDLPIGTRLGFGFGIVLLLATISSCIGLWRLNEVASSTRAMMQEPLKKERLTEEWYRVTVAGLKRTLAVVKSSDESLGDFFLRTLRRQPREIMKFRNTWKVTSIRLTKNNFWKTSLLYVSPTSAPETRF